MSINEECLCRYGRLMVATLEAKVEKYEEEMGKLQKCLEKSDAYIEDIEKELEEYRKKLRVANSCSRCKVALASLTEDIDVKLKHEKMETGEERRELTNHNREAGSSKGKGHGKSTRSGQNEDKQSPKSKGISMSNFYGKKSRTLISESATRVTEFTKPYDKTKRSADQIQKTKVEDQSTSFELEMPSPTTPASSLSKLSIKTEDSPSDMEGASGQDRSMVSLAETSALTDNTDITANDSGSSGASLESCTKKLKFDSNGNNDNFYSKQSQSDGKGMEKQVTFSESVDRREMLKTQHCDKELFSGPVFRLGENPKKPPRAPKGLFDLAGSSSSSTDEDADPNMSVDIADCMRLLDEAEKKVEQNKTEGQPAINIDPWPIPALPERVVNSGIGSTVGGSSVKSSLIDYRPQAFKNMNQSLKRPKESVLGSSSHNFPLSTSATMSTTTVSKAPENHKSLTFHGPTGQYSIPVPAALNTSSQIVTDNTVSSLSQSYPPRPASTSTLEKMLQQVSGLENDTRPPSAPPIGPLLGAQLTSHHMSMSSIPEFTNPSNFDSKFSVQTLSSSMPSSVSAGNLSVQSSTMSGPSRMFGPQSGGSLAAQKLPGISSFSSFGSGPGLSQLSSLSQPGSLGSSSLSQPVTLSATNFTIPGLPGSTSTQPGSLSQGGLGSPASSVISWQSNKRGLEQLADQYLQSKGLGNMNWKSQ